MIWSPKKKLYLSTCILLSVPDDCYGNESEGEYRLTQGGLCIFVSRFKQTFFHAREQCVRRGGDLLKLASNTDHKEVVRLLNEINSGESYTWIGVTKREYIWMSGNNIIVLMIINFNRLVLRNSLLSFASNITRDDLKTSQLFAKRKTWQCRSRYSCQNKLLESLYITQYLRSIGIYDGLQGRRTCDHLYIEAPSPRGVIIT